MSKLKQTEPLDEPVLADNYPVHWDYAYVCDGEVKTVNYSWHCG